MKFDNREYALLKNAVLQQVIEWGNERDYCFDPDIRFKIEQRHAEYDILYRKLESEET